MFLLHNLISLYQKILKKILNTKFIIKIGNKRELQQTAFNHSSDIDFKDFINLYKKCTAKPYSSLVNDSTLASDNFTRFRDNFLGRISNIIMTIDDYIRDENYNMILVEKQQKYQYYHVGKFKNMNIYQVKKNYLLIN